MARQKKNVVKFDGKDRIVSVNDPKRARTNRMFLKAAVDLYVSVQKRRIDANNKLKAVERGCDQVIEYPFIESVRDEFHKVEKMIPAEISKWAEADPLGQWALQIKGLGGNLVGSLLGHIDFHTCCCKQYEGIKRNERPKHDCPGLITSGALKKYAGVIDPKFLVWGKGERRPYNSRLKTICCGLIGESWKKLSVNEGKLLATDDDLAQDICKAYAEKGKEIPVGKQLEKLVTAKRARAMKKWGNLDGDAYLYIRYYMQRKKMEIERNENGLNREYAHMLLEKARRLGSNISPDMRKIWSSGKLQAGGVDRRAMRKALGLFLSHFHEVGYNLIFNRPTPAPYAMRYSHAHYIPPPLWTRPVYANALANGTYHHQCIHAE